MKKGFTLIELLVVISIIALLSSVVISSLSAARSKAADTDVKATMKQMHGQAQNYLDSGNVNFGLGLTDCSSGVFADPQFASMRANVLTNALAGATMACATDVAGFKWAVSVSALKGGGTWCTDNSQGWFKAGSAQTSGGSQGTCQ